MEASAEAPLIKHTNMPSSTSIASVASPRQALPSIASFFCCPVCWGHTHWDNTVALSGCGHRFCVVCLKHALTMQISDGLVDLVCCSHVATSGAPRRCRRPIAAEDVRRVLTAETWKTFQRFRFYRNNPNARACPHCGHGQVVENGWEQPLCVCTQCSKTFCFLHDDAHPGDECATYTNAMEATEAPTRALLERTTRPCPRCYHAIEKSGGCNLITCFGCRTHFCWECSAIVSSSDPWTEDCCRQLSPPTPRRPPRQLVNAEIVDGPRSVMAKFGLLGVPEFIVVSMLALVVNHFCPFANIRELLSYVGAMSVVLGLCCGAYLVWGRTCWKH